MRILPRIFIMKIHHLLEDIKTSGIFYHGSENRFDHFDVSANKVNRATNVSGIYFTPREHEAHEYGEHIIKARITSENPFYFNKKNEITPEMQSKAKELLLKYTNYKEQWLENAIIPDFVEKGNFRSMSDVSGEIKREILLTGGYDSYVDGDHVVILEPSKKNIEIVRK